MFQVVCVKDKYSTNKYWLDKLYSTLHSLGKHRDPKYRNYSYEKLDLGGHLCFHILLGENDEIVTGSGVYNGNRYPRGVYRVLNRVFVTPKYRSKTLKPFCLATKYILPIQLTKYKDDVVDVFVSREGKNGHFFLKYWINHHAPGREREWVVLSDMVHVVPNGNDKKCYQYIAIKKNRKNYWKPKTISFSDWQKLSKPERLKQ